MDHEENLIDDTSDNFTCAFTYDGEVLFYSYGLQDSILWLHPHPICYLFQLYFQFCVDDTSQKET